MIISSDTICALSTPSGSGALGVIRLSGQESISIANSIFVGKDLSQQKGQSLHFGKIMKGEEVLDEVLVSLFKGPASYTGEDVIEISCHGSAYILQECMELLMDHGARLAKPGEFTMRAFANGKLDLTQAEAVTDLIASETRASHQLAMNQMRGGFSEKIQELRVQLIHFTALIELELDFSEEDVEFADRQDLKDLVHAIIEVLSSLINSFKTGNVLKNGIPVAIVGKPNVGKSSLLNAILKEERAIVSNIAGTTRDSIEDEMIVGGLNYRFIDTAGIRETTDEIESIGIERTFKMIQKAQLILLLIDAANETKEGLQTAIKEINDALREHQELLVVFNKMDLVDQSHWQEREGAISMSLKEGEGMSALESFFDDYSTNLMEGANQLTVSNVRHLEALKLSKTALERVLDGLDSGITGDFLAMDIRQALFHLGEITGSIDIDRDILGAIFSRFCIGK